MPIDSIENGLWNLLPKVKHQVYLQAFFISERMLQMIFEGSRNWKQLVLMGWKIANLNPDFSIDHNFIYSLKQLGLKETISENELQRINKVSFKILVKAMANTNIKLTLEELLTGTTKLYQLDRILKLLMEFDFKATVGPSLLREAN